MPDQRAPGWIEAHPYAALLGAAACFAGNVVVGRALHGLVPPFALTFWRWLLVVVVLIPFTAPALWRHRALVRRQPFAMRELEARIRALGWRGRLVVIGFAAGRIPEVKANYLLLKNIAVAGLQWSDYRERDPAWVARAQQSLYKLYLEKKLKPEITATYPLARFADALARFEQRSVQGKLLLVP